jgi:hypothetical protein
VKGAETNIVKICKIGVLAFFAWAMVATPVAASPISYEYTSTALDGGPGAGISYALVIDDVSGAATFTVDGASASSELWYGGWFTFKFIEGATPSDITSFGPPASSGPWSVADVNQNSAVKVLQGGTHNQLLNGASTGFYVTSLAENGAADDPTQGVCLTGCLPLDLPSVFTFTVTLPSGWDRDIIPFQVGFYGEPNRQGKWTTNQLSRELDPPNDVPDGGDTFALMAGALVCVAASRRLFTA